jgi:hypothetical protein
MASNMATIKKIILTKVYYRYIRAKSFVDYIIHRLSGGSFVERLGGRNKLEEIAMFLESRQPQKIALYLAYHADAITPSNLRYIKSLQRCGFCILYILNAKLGREAHHKLTNLGVFPVQRKNIGQDFGGWKDGILALRKIGFLNRLEWLLICNDSMLFAGDSLISSFEDKFTARLSESDTKSPHTLALNINYDEEEHLQSFFVCMNNNVINNNKFLQFWQDYKPISNRYHTISNGEKKLSRTIRSGGSTTEVLYTTADLLDALMLLQDLQSQELLVMSPLNCSFLEAVLEDEKPTKLQLMKFVSWLECYNQSHVFSLLFSRFLQSPFLKKDLTKMGVFSIAQISLYLSEDALFTKDEQAEIISEYARKGKHVSYSGSIYRSVREGVPSLGPDYTKNQLLKP